MEEDLSVAQAQLLQTEKARVAADLAGMAAHELNQPLTSVLGYAEMLKRRITPADKKLTKPVEVVFREAERMADIVKKIGRITRHEIKSYGAQTTMMDLDRSTKAAGDEVSDEGQLSPEESVFSPLISQTSSAANRSIIRPETIDPKSQERVEARKETDRSITASEMQTIADDFDDPQENTRPEVHVAGGDSKPDPVEDES